MTTNVSAESPIARPRMPRQYPGITRGSGAVSAAALNVGGVEAAGILEYLFGDEAGGVIGDVVDSLPGGSIFHGIADAIYAAV